MWLFGQATEEEIKKMNQQEWEVEEVNKVYFNKSLDLKYNPEEDADLNAHDGDKLVAVFIDNDISKQLTKWYNEGLAKAL